MFELAKLVKQKYKNFDITPQHLDQVIREHENGHGMNTFHKQDIVNQ